MSSLHFLKVSSTFAPMRIISLVPSLTQTLFDLGLEQSVVGITPFCVRPPNKVGAVSKVGGPKNPNLAKIEALKPDLVVMNKEENLPEHARAISSFTHVLTTAISTVQEALSETERIGRETNRLDQAHKLTTEIASLLPQKPNDHPLRTAYFIWRKPWMSVGGDTYIHDVMRLFGLENVFGNHQRYPEVSLEQLPELGTELVLLSSEPYAFATKHKREFVSFLAPAQIHCVDGEWFSWYGSGMLSAFRSLQKWRDEIDSHV